MWRKHSRSSRTAAIGGKIYVAGARYSGGSFTDPITDSLDVYDPEQNEWQLAAKLLRPRGGVNGVAAFDCFHVWGGEAANTGEPNNVFRITTSTIHARTLGSALQIYRYRCTA